MILVFLTESTIFVIILTVRTALTFTHCSISLGGPLPSTIHTLVFSRLFGRMGVYSRAIIHLSILVQICDDILDIVD